MMSLKLWLDRNVELDLSHAAMYEAEKALRSAASYIEDNARRSREPVPNTAAELLTAANQVRAHLQHLPPLGIPLHHKDPPEGLDRKSVV